MSLAKESPLSFLDMIIDDKGTSSNGATVKAQHKSVTLHFAISKLRFEQKPTREEG